MTVFLFCIQKGIVLTRQDAFKTSTSAIAVNRTTAQEDLRSWKLRTEYPAGQVVHCKKAGRKKIRPERQRTKWLRDYNNHGLIHYIDTKAKCRHLKILTCKGTLRQVFIRVYRLEIKSIMLVFLTQLFELWPLSPSLWLISVYCVEWTRLQCVGGGGMGFWASGR